MGYYQGLSHLCYAASPSGWRVHTRTDHFFKEEDSNPASPLPDYVKYLKPPYVPPNSEALERMQLYNAVDRRYNDQNPIFLTEPARKYQEEQVTTHKSISATANSWLPIQPLVDEPVMEQEETRSKQLSTYIQSSPSDYQRKTRRKWSPEPQSRTIQRNPRRIKTSHKKSPVWRRIQDLKSLPGLPAAVALSIIGTILAM